MSKAVYQASKQANRQASKNTQFWFNFSLRTMIAKVGEPRCVGELSAQVVKNPTDASPSTGSIPSYRIGDRYVNSIDP